MASLLQKFIVILIAFCVAQSTLALELILDNAAPTIKDGTRSFTGTWCHSQAIDPYAANSLYSCGSSVDRYRWTPAITTPGDYDVYVWWSSYVNRSAAVPIAVRHSAGIATKTFNEKLAGGKWVLHGRYNFNVGSTGYVEVSDANGQASADAVRFVSVTSTTNSDAPAIHFIDVEAGPVAGGPGGFGVPIAIFGRGFGATRGSSKVTINGVEVARYMIWGQHNANNVALDMIVVQPAVNTTAGPIVVTINGLASNSEYRFTPSGGKVYYVAPSGADSAPCNETQPCATILHVATEVMVAGDALLVRGGTLNDNEVWIRDVLGHSGQPGKPKIIRNYPGEMPEFSIGVRPFLLEANYITLSGIHFKNGKSLGVGSETNVGNRVYNNTFRGTIDYDAVGTHGNDIDIAGNDCDVPSSTQGTQGHCFYISTGSNIRLRYNIARGAPGYGIHIFDQRRSANDILRVISNVLVEGNLLTASPERSGMIIAMGDEDARGNHIDGVIVRNNLFVANNFAGIAVGGNTRNVTIYHNTFYQNGRQGITLYDDATVNGVEIINNLFDQSANINCKANCAWYDIAHIQKGFAAQNVVINNNFYTPGPTIIIGGGDASAVTGNGGFVNGAAGDFHLTLISAAINKGAVLLAAPKDFDGRLRPIGTKSEPGAFEFH